MLKIKPPTNFDTLIQVFKARVFDEWLKSNDEQSEFSKGIDLIISEDDY